MYKIFNLIRVKFINISFEECDIILQCSGFYVGELAVEFHFLHALKALRDNHMI